jgi:hypothetical protein
MIGYPSTRNFLKIIKRNLIPNYAIGRADILATEDILGPHMGSLKGKTVRFDEQHIKSDLTPIPHDILSLYREVILCIDIMYVNKIAFLITISQHLKFATIKLLANCQEDTVEKCLTYVMEIYGSRDFVVNMTHADGEFEVVRGRLADARSTLNVCSNDEHVLGRD